jgi:hypothetical protein
MKTGKRKKKGRESFSVCCNIESDCLKLFHTAEWTYLDLWKYYQGERKSFKTLSYGRMEVFRSMKILPWRKE